MELRKTFTGGNGLDIAAANQRSLVNLSWLIKLRWVACLGQLVVIAVVIWMFDIALPYEPLAAVISSTLVTNVGYTSRSQR